MAQNGGKRAFRIIAGAGELIGVADTGCLDFNQHLTGLGTFQVYFDDFQWLTGLKCNSCTGFHCLPSNSKRRFHFGAVCQ